MEKKSKKGRENSRYIPRCSHNRRVIATDRDRGVIAAELSRGSRLIVNSSFASAVDKLYHGSSISTRRFTHSTAKENAIACSSVSYTLLHVSNTLSLSLFVPCTNENERFLFFFFFFKTTILQAKSPPNRPVREEREGEIQQGSFNVIYICIPLGKDAPLVMKRDGRVFLTGIYDRPAKFISPSSFGSVSRFIVSRMEQHPRL